MNKKDEKTNLSENKEKSKDIKMHFKKATLKLRACGIIERNGKYLVDCTQINHFYSFPGGHIQIGESSKTAAEREVAEETGINAEAVQLVAITEVFLGDNKRKMLHEIDFHYLMNANNYKGPNSFYRTEIDAGKKKKHNYAFMTIEEMEGKDIRPEHIVEILKSRQFGRHIIQDKRLQQ